MTKAIVLYSGGLDSRLAVKILEEQGIEVIPVLFKLPFSCADCKIPFDKEVVEIDCTKGKLYDEYLNIIKKPNHGVGTAVNPCIDCKIFIFKNAKKLMKKLDVQILATGEVLGERPMSQEKSKMEIIDKHCDIEILRPLSAKIMPITSYEKKGLVNRELLHDIHGRRRVKQIGLAKKYELKFPNPSGGCVLCEKKYAPKFSDLLKYNSKPNLYELQTLKGFRHFRGKGKILIGRNESENIRLKEISKYIKYQLMIPKEPGPTAIFEKKEDGNLANEIIHSYANKKNKEKYDQYKVDLEIVTAKPADKTTLHKLRSELIKHQNQVNSDNVYNNEKIINSNKLIENYMKQKNSIYFIAKIDRKAIGFIHGTIDPDKNGGYLQDLYVKEEYRNRKIGTKLLNILNHWFKNKNIVTYGLTTDNTNENQSTLNFYKKLGFEIKKKDEKIIYLTISLV